MRAGDAMTGEPRADQRIGIVVVAYNTAGTLLSVLDRIPRDFRPRVAHVVVCDDASTDSTYQIC